MINIQLQAVPTQSFSFQDNQQNYDIAIKTCGSGDAQVMAFDVTINGVVTVTGVRAVAGFPIIASAYKQNGNFIITTENDDLPDYTKFGLTQFFVFASQVEIDAINLAAQLAQTALEDLT